MIGKLNTNWITRVKKTMLFWIAIIALAIVGKIFYFWVIIPALLGIVVFYSIQYHKSKLYLVYPAIIVGTLLLFFSAGELYFWKPVEISTKIETSVKYPDADIYKLNVKDPILGYGTKWGVEIGSRLMRGEEVIYDVLYTMDEKGRRITPDNSATADSLVLLFGCSFTYGEGLNDSETFAWQLSELLGPKFQVYNYGFHGYGSHQMLALIESDRLDYFKNKYKNIYAYYLTFSGIEMRSAGLSPWDSNGPQYEFDEDGAVYYAGKFSDNKIKQEDKFRFRGKFAQSQFLQKVLSLYQGAPKTVRLPKQEKMLELHTAIIKRSADELYKKFDSDSFTVAFYEDYAGFKKQLENNKLGFIDMTNSFPVLPSVSYTIPYDGHPTHAATKIIAKEYYDDIMAKMNKAGL